MSRHLLVRLVTVVLMASGLLGLGTPAHADDPCDGSSPVSIGDYIMWDSVDGGQANLMVSARIPCKFARFISYATFDITARAGEDYVGVQSAVLVLPAGRTSTTLTIHVLGYTSIEPPETFGVRLLAGATFEDPEAIVTILDR